MFLNLDQKEPTSLAVMCDDGITLTYGDLCESAKEFGRALPYRTLVILLAENSAGSLLGYTSLLSNHIVPLIISNKTDRQLIDSFCEKYQPEYMWMPTERIEDFGLANEVYSIYGYSLVKTEYVTPQMYDELSLLLPTSGSTGSPKLVRHSYKNIEANAENVNKLFKLTPNEKAMVILPMHYTMGLSVIASHLYTGATILLCSKSMLDPIFWKMLKEEATSFTGVPYSFDLLNKMRFFRMNLPNLKIITQGGGKLTKDMWNILVDYAEANGKKFIATYGQSECTARMAYLPAELAKSKVCSIGYAEPGGKLSIIDAEGNETFDGEDKGEMAYRGANVTLGYAECKDDLRKGDENNGFIRTGDIARRDSDGCYFIEGRMKRFLKIFGLRISLDEVENLITCKYNTDCYCSGDDECLLVKLTNKDIVGEIPSFIEEKTHLFHQRIKIVVVESILRNEAGKVINQ